jgi:uncharacterized protein (TIGR03083 family)
VEPRKSALSRPVAMRLAAVEYDRCAETFRSLTPAQWAMPTDCPAWDVRQLAAHMLGMAEMAASIRENLRQQRKAAQAAKAGALYIDALTQLQVDERADWTPARITERYAARAPKASAGRRRTPAFVRSRTMPQSQEVNGVTEPWTLGYLIDVILTRDPWMHRMDIAAATGTAPPLTAGHDGVIVEPTPTGPAGGTWRAGANGPAWTLDAIDFCRAISRRPASLALDELMNTEVPY